VFIGAVRRRKTTIQRKIGVKKGYFCAQSGVFAHGGGGNLWDFFSGFWPKRSFLCIMGGWRNLGVKCGIWGLSGRISGVNGWSSCGDFFSLTEFTEFTEFFFLIFLSPTDCTDFLQDYCFVRHSISKLSSALSYRNNCSDFFSFFLMSSLTSSKIARRIYTDVTRCARDFVECTLSPLRGFVLVVSLPGVNTPVYVLLSLRDLVTRFARSDARTERPYNSLFPTPCSLLLLPSSLKKGVIVAEGGWGGWHKFD
jgi:hypothetical protein